MINPAMVQKAALELYERHGKLALEIAHERAERLSRQGDPLTLDTALMVLTEVEKLVGKTNLLNRPRYGRVH
jgi:hypothetical protein